MADLSSLSNLFQNKLFLQYLSGAGAAMSEGQQIGSALNEVTQKNITAQNFSKLLAKLMGDAGDSKTPGKVTTDGNKLTYTTELGGMGGIAGPIPAKPAAAAGGEAEGGTTGMTPVQTQNKDLMSLLNPSTSSAMSGADLAGLTPDMISQALQFKFGMDKFEQQKIKDIADMTYKGALTRESEARAKALGMAKPIFAKGVPGYGDLNLDQYKALPTSDREYITHVLSARELGKAPLTRAAFEALDDKDKDKDPTTAMGAAIARHIDETGKLPPDSELKRWTEMFREKPQPKTRALVTWTTAYDRLSQLFGKKDIYGMWAVTPENQAAHDKAQEFLVEYKKAGADPLQAIGESNKRARKWLKNREERYFQYLDAAEGIKDKRQREDRVGQVKNAYLKAYGYVPSTR